MRDCDEMATKFQSHLRIVPKNYHNNNALMKVPLTSREKAFRLLDWINELPTTQLVVNTLLQIGIEFQKSGIQQSADPIEQMAAEQVSAEIYQLAVQIARKHDPALELYAGIVAVKCLSTCTYNTLAFGNKSVSEALRERVLWIIDLFPFAQVISFMLCMIFILNVCTCYGS